MKLKRLFSGALATALITSVLSFSTYADINKKPLEIGFETGKERWDSDNYDFLDKPYSLHDGNYYMGLSIQNGKWTNRGAVNRFNLDLKGHDAKNVNGDKITGINSYCPWSHLYQDGYALITHDKNGVALKSPVCVFGPAGIFYDESEGKKGIKEYAQLHDAKITGNGTYTVGIQGFNWKEDTAESASEFGNGLNLLYISSNIMLLEGETFEIKNPVLKLYNTKKEYDTKKPYKTIKAEYWVDDQKTYLNNVTQRDERSIEYEFVNSWRRIDNHGNEIDAKYLDNDGQLDVFGMSGYTGNKSDKYETGYEGCSFLPEYAIEITFDVNMSTKKTSTKPVHVTTKKQKAIKSSATKPVVKTKKATIKKLTLPKKKTLKVTWEKVSGAKGYEIKLATNKKFTKNKKTVKIKKGSATSKTIKKLKRGKKYFVKIRAYKKVEIDGYTVTANGPWSKVKSKKVK